MGHGPAYPDASFALIRLRDAAPPGVPVNKWMHLDTARIEEGVLKTFDPFGAATEAISVVSALKDVRQVDSTHYSGTIDMAKFADQVSGSVPNVVQSSGAQVSDAAFTAEVDAQNRLTQLKLDLPEDGSADASVEVSFSQYGVPVTVTRPPAADVVKAPEAAYSIFGN